MDDEPKPKTDSRGMSKKQPKKDTLYPIDPLRLALLTMKKELKQMGPDEKVERRKQLQPKLTHNSDIPIDSKEFKDALNVEKN